MLSGGKFANGAITAAFAVMYNEMAHCAGRACGSQASEDAKDGQFLKDAAWAMTPGSDVADCFSAQCSAFGWAAAVAGVIPGPGKALGRGARLLYRFRNGPESAGRLGRKAAEAESAIGIHGVSTTTNIPSPGIACGVACYDDVVKAFPVHKTGGPGHYTVELPKPVSPEDAAKFNDLFKD